MTATRSIKRNMVMSPDTLRKFIPERRYEIDNPNNSGGRRDHFLKKVKISAAKERAVLGQ